MELAGTHPRKERLKEAAVGRWEERSTGCKGGSPPSLPGWWTGHSAEARPSPAAPPSLPGTCTKLRNPSPHSEGAVRSGEGELASTRLLGRAKVQESKSEQQTLSHRVSLGPLQKTRVVAGLCEGRGFVRGGAVWGRGLCEGGAL